MIKPERYKHTISDFHADYQPKDEGPVKAAGYYIAETGYDDFVELMNNPPDVEVVEEDGHTLYTLAFLKAPVQVQFEYWVHVARSVGRI